MHSENYAEGREALNFRGTTQFQEQKTLLRVNVPLINSAYATLIILWLRRNPDLHSCRDHPVLSSLRTNEAQPLTRCSRRDLNIDFIIAYELFLLYSKTDTLSSTPQAPSFANDGGHYRDTV